VQIILQTIAYYCSSNCPSSDVLVFKNKDPKINIITGHGRQITVEYIYLIHLFIILKKMISFLRVLQRPCFEIGYSLLTVALFWHNEQIFICEPC
jgi:hypothetical protein